MSVAKIQVSHLKFHQINVADVGNGVHVQTGNGDATLTGVDIQNGNFNFPEEGFAVFFMDDENGPKGRDISGCYIRNAEIVSVVEIEEENPVLAAKAKRWNETHIARVATGQVENPFTLLILNKNDVVVAGSNGHWEVVKRHPDIELKLGCVA